MTTTPMTSDQLLAALRSEGVKVVEHAGWRGHGRPGDWGPVHGSMVHHTASSDSTVAVDLCFNGRPDLAGPLCHGVIRKDGTAHLVGSGRANHAGSGSSATLAAVVNGLPLPARPGPDNTGGNSHWYGWEAINRGDGKDPWPAAQVEAIVRVQAAVCRHHGWTADHVIGHKEWTGRKIDPHGVSMDDLRERIALRLAVAPKPAGTYVVRPGDTLYGIARAHHVEPNALLAANPRLAADPEGLQPGDEVTIPGTTPKPPAPKPAAPRWPGVYLKRGSTGSHVKTWQRRLGVTQDGVFGPKTEAATEALQRKKKLTVDKTVGPKTWAAAFK